MPNKIREHFPENCEASYIYIYTSLNCTRNVVRVYVFNFI